MKLIGWLHNTTCQTLRDGTSKIVPLNYLIDSLLDQYSYRFFVNLPGPRNRDPETWKVKQSETPFTGLGGSVYGLGSFPGAVFLLTYVSTTTLTQMGLGTRGRFWDT